MELSAHELMCMYDAMIAYTIRPEFVDCPTIEAFHERICEKIEKELNAQGFTFNGHVEYSGATS